MIKKLALNIISSILGLWLANYILVSFEAKGGLVALMVGGLLLGLVNFLVKPILKVISLPLRIITLGLFGFLIDIFLVWAIIDVILWQYFEIQGIIALFQTTLIIWLSQWLFLKFAK